MEDQEKCPIKAAVSVIGGKWKTGILFRLAERPYRFGELNREMTWVSEKVLIRQLRELQDSGVVHRKDYGEVPPRVEYSLTEHGKTLKPLLQAIADWGQGHLRRKDLPLQPAH